MCACSGPSLVVCSGCFCGTGSHLQALLHSSSWITLLPFRPPRGCGRLTAPGGLPVVLGGSRSRARSGARRLARPSRKQRGTFLWGAHAGKSWACVTQPATPLAKDPHGSVCSTSIWSCACGLPRATISVQRGASVPGALCISPSIPAASASTAGPGGPSGSTEAPYGGARRSVCLSVTGWPSELQPSRHASSKALLVFSTSGAHHRSSGTQSIALPRSVTEIMMEKRARNDTQGVV